MEDSKKIKTIVRWIRQYAKGAKIDTLVVGISGGIDSSVVSVLCAQTGLKTIVVQMPIRQNKTLNNRSSMQAAWLQQHYPENVIHINVDLTTVFSAFERKLGPVCSSEQESNLQEQLAWANSRSRLRMMALYQIAQSHNALVVGTGNKVEDFGVGFFTKYGDGGVDINPIGDCLKTEVWNMGRTMGLPEEIIEAAPTDGLWDDGRTDEDQIGMSYPELERAMSLDQSEAVTAGSKAITALEKQQLRRYWQIRARNLHKMLPIPVCKFDNN